MSRNRLAQLVARAMMTVGLGVGALAIGLWVFDIQIELPAWMWRVAIAKLTLAGAAGLLVVGATLLRHLRRAEQARHASDGALLPDEQRMAELGAPNATLRQRQREKAPARKGRFD